MKTLALSTLALTFINVELAFALLAAAGVLIIAVSDYTPHRLVTGVEV